MEPQELQGWQRCRCSMFSTFWNCFFFHSEFSYHMPQCHINNFSCALRSELMWSQRAAATRNWKWWSSKLLEKEGLNQQCFYLTQVRSLSSFVNHSQTPLPFAKPNQAEVWSRFRSFLKPPLLLLADGKSRRRFNISNVYMVYIAHYDELNLQISNYAQIGRICRNFCHPG